MKPFGWIDKSDYSRIKKIMPLPCVDLLVINAGKMLLMKRNNPPMKNRWFTPGSRILLGESLEDAVKRTLKEETGLTAQRIVQTGTLSCIFDELQAITTLYIVEVDNTNVVMNDEHSEYKWISKINVEIHPYIKKMIETAKIFK